MSPSISSLSLIRAYSLFCNMNNSVYVLNLLVSQSVLSGACKSQAIIKNNDVGVLIHGRYDQAPLTNISTPTHIAQALSCLLHVRSVNFDRFSMNATA